MGGGGLTFAPRLALTGDLGLELAKDPNDCFLKLPTGGGGLTLGPRLTLAGLAGERGVIMLGDRTMGLTKGRGGDKGRGLLTVPRT